MLFEIIFLLDSYSRRSLKFFVWYGLSDTFTKTWPGALSFVFIVFSLPATVVNGSKSFSFPACSLIRIVSSTTPRSASLVHGFTCDESVPYLFSTTQTKLKFLSTCWKSFSYFLHVARYIVNIFNSNAEKPTFSSSTVVYFTLADLLGNQ